MTSESIAARPRLVIECSGLKGTDLFPVLMLLRDARCWWRRKSYSVGCGKCDSVAVAKRDEEVNRGDMVQQKGTFLD